MEYQTLGRLCDQVCWSSYDHYRSGQTRTFLVCGNKQKSTGKIRASTNGTGLQSLPPSLTASGSPAQGASSGLSGCRAGACPTGPAPSLSLGSAQLQSLAVTRPLLLRKALTVLSGNSMTLPCVNKRKSFADNYTTSTGSNETQSLYKSFLKFHPETLYLMGNSKNSEPHRVPLDPA